jgi:hypothetical protein
MLAIHALGTLHTWTFTYAIYKRTSLGPGRLCIVAALCVHREAALPSFNLTLELSCMSAFLFLQTACMSSHAE